jgi:hypothetical protein
MKSKNICPCGSYVNKGSKYCSYECHGKFGLRDVETHKKVLTLALEGLSFAQIGREMGFSRQRAHQIWKKYKELGG